MTAAAAVSPTHTMAVSQFRTCILIVHWKKSALSANSNLKLLFNLLSFILQCLLAWTACLRLFTSCVDWFAHSPKQSLVIIK